MPRPLIGETQKEYLKRCIPYEIHKGNASSSKQAAAICYSIWRKESPITSIVTSFDVSNGLVNSDNSRNSRNSRNSENPKVNPTFDHNARINYDYDSNNNQTNNNQINSNNNEDEERNNINDINDSNNNEERNNNSEYTEYSHARRARRRGIMIGSQLDFGNNNNNNGNSNSRKNAFEYARYDLMEL